MNAAKTLLAAPVLAAAFFVVAAPEAAADCMYVPVSPNDSFMPSALNGMASVSANKAVLGDLIAVDTGFDENILYDVGSLMNFSCLHDAEVTRFYTDKPFAPYNSGQIGMVKALTDSMADQDHPVHMNLRAKKGEYLSADITCENIALNFDPKTFLSGPSDEDQKTKIFMGSVISLLFHAEALRQAGTNFVGHYEIAPDNVSTFRPSVQNNPCTAQIS